MLCDAYTPLVVLYPLKVCSATENLLSQSFDGHAYKEAQAVTDGNEFLE